jgi:hypothetical protein
MMIPGSASGIDATIIRGHSMLNPVQKAYSSGVALWTASAYSRLLGCDQ